MSGTFRCPLCKRSLETLRAAEPMRRWIKWAGRQGGGRVAVRASHAKKNRSKVKDYELWRSLMRMDMT